MSREPEQAQGVLRAGNSGMLESIGVGDVACLPCCYSWASVVLVTVCQVVSTLSSAQIGDLQLWAAREGLKGALHLVLHTFPLLSLFLLCC